MADSNPVVASIRHSIEKNGFPDKSVKLPFKPVYESCKQNQTSLAEVLKALETQGIRGTFQGNHIVFRNQEKADELKQSEQTKKTEPDPALWEFMAGMNPGETFPGASNFGDLQNLIQKFSNQLTPDQWSEIQKQLENMSEEEKQKILTLFSQMVKPPKDSS